MSVSHSVRAWGALGFFSSCLLRTRSQGLYEEEIQMQQQQQMQQEAARRQAVGGLMNPYEVQDDMADI